MGDRSLEQIKREVYSLALTRATTPRWRVLRRRRMHREIQTLVMDHFLLSTEVKP